MFDNLREEAHGFGEEEGTPFQPASGTVSGPITGRRPRRLFGMTSVQRFTIAVLFMATVCVFGVMLLFVTGRIGF